jgi:hypothetical protein
MDNWIRTSKVSHTTYECNTKENQNGIDELSTFTVKQHWKHIIAKNYFYSHSWKCVQIRLIRS